jgi:hypothetical protein
VFYFDFRIDIDLAGRFMDHFPFCTHFSSHHQALRLVPALCQTSLNQQYVNPLFLHGLILSLKR